MRDFPVFTTENGVASIVLKEIPYSGIAYVTIRDSASPTEFLLECTEFCRAVGAQTLYATGHNILDAYSRHVSVIQMATALEGIPDTDACLFPVTEKTVNLWREIYNERMKNVDNVAYMSERMAKEMINRGDGYFIHRYGELLGIGIASDERIDCIATVKRGSGRDVIAALTHALVSERIVLEVADTNDRAMRLYESLGFIKTKVVSEWYKIF